MMLRDIPRFWLKVRESSLFENLWPWSKKDNEDKVVGQSSPRQLESSLHELSVSACSSNVILPIRAVNILRKSVLNAL
jgi:hypothetical protein